MKLFIKHMVSHRCKIVVRQLIKNMHINTSVIVLGMVETIEDLTPVQIEELRSRLLYYSFELIDDKNKILVDKIKQLISEMICPIDFDQKITYQKVIADSLNCNYEVASKVFLEVTKTSIKDYIIFSRIEKAKELLQKKEITLLEISHKLNYCSVAHLSVQFKHITGCTPSVYKKINSI